MPKVWTPADFLDKAQELIRGLEAWHLDGNEPLHMPDFREMQRLIRLPFRDRILSGHHDLAAMPPSSQTFFCHGSEPCDPVDETVGFIVDNLPDLPSKYLTSWLFRDFYEHLSDAGDSEAAKLLRLKVNRLLNAPMNRIARCSIGEYVGGHLVDPALVQEFLDAAKGLSIEPSDKRSNPFSERPTRSIKLDFDAKKDGVETNAKSSNELTNEEKALAILAGNPNVSKAEIARRLGINVRTLGGDRMPRFDRAWQVVKAKEGKVGLVNADGTVDAIHYDEEPDI